MKEDYNPYVDMIASLNEKAVWQEKWSTTDMELRRGCCGFSGEGISNAFKSPSGIHVL